MILISDTSISTDHAMDYHLVQTLSAPDQDYVLIEDKWMNDARFIRGEYDETK